MDQTRCAPAVTSTAALLHPQVTLCLCHFQQYKTFCHKLKRLEVFYTVNKFPEQTKTNNDLIWCHLSSLPQTSVVLFLHVFMHLGERIEHFFIFMNELCCNFERNYTKF